MFLKLTISFYTFSTPKKVTQSNQGNQGNPLYFCV